MSGVLIPRLLLDSVEDDDDPVRVDWLARLPTQVGQIAAEWGLELGDPYDPGGTCSWVAPVRAGADAELVLKVGWRHFEAEHEGDALRLWDGDGAVRCLQMRSFEATAVLLLERCVPGVQLKRSLPEPDQDVVVAGLLRRLWGHVPPAGHPFRALSEMCEQWAEDFEQALSRRSKSTTAENSGASEIDQALVAEGIALFRELPASAESESLLCTDLHGENILSAQRESWLVVDPKPYVGDPAYDVCQHMLNCEERLALEPVALANRMASLLDLDRERVRLWLFARCATDSVYDASLGEPARRLAP